jgi:hypothetical protein
LTSWPAGTMSLFKNRHSIANSIGLTILLKRGCPNWKKKEFNLFCCTYNETFQIKTMQGY